MPNTLTPIQYTHVGPTQRYEELSTPVSGSPTTTVYFDGDGDDSLDTYQRTQDGKPAGQGLPGAGKPYNAQFRQGRAQLIQNAVHAAESVVDTLNSNQRICGQTNSTRYVTLHLPGQHNYAIAATCPDNQCAVTRFTVNEGLRTIINIDPTAQGEHPALRPFVDLSGALALLNRACPPPQKKTDD